MIWLFMFLAFASGVGWSLTLRELDKTLEGWEETLIALELALNALEKRETYGNN